MAKVFAIVERRAIGVAILRSIMAKMRAIQPTEVELQMLRILWELGPSPVREIHARLNAEKGTNYSTTVKMLSVMLEKGLVKRDEKASPHIYRPSLTRETAGKRMLQNLIEKVYDGAAMTLVLQALASTAATKDELDEVRRMLDQMEGKQS
jgi:predicted transcriptional regulator